jgi:hypothetical protein
MRLILSLLIILTATAVHSQHKIHIKINGLKNSQAFLGRYLDNNSFYCDTAKVNAKGEFVFEGRKTLDEGMYFVSVETGKLFEFVVGENQIFDMETSAQGCVKNMKVENDQDNMIFFESLVFNLELYKEAEPLLKSIHDNTFADDKKRAAQIALNRIKLRGIAYQEEIIENYPNTITAKLFKSIRNIELGEQPSDVNTASQKEWYQSHLGLF